MLMPNNPPDNLSFTTLEKSKELINRKTKKDATFKSFYHYANFTAVLVTYIVLFNSRYLYYLPSLFGGLSQTTSVPQIAKVLDMTILLGCIVSCFLLYSKSIQYKESNQKFNSLRIDLLESSAENFCKCNNTCDCKDEYIKYMLSEEGIDLIFK